jgi:photosystem II stability/assembly factor-like uncharacterized protein
MRIRKAFCLAACLVASVSLAGAHQPHDPMVTVAVSPNYAQDHTLLVATGALSVKPNVFVLMKSVDGGVTWTAVEGLPGVSQMTQIVFSPAYNQDQTIFIAGTGGLFRTTNQGASWSLLYKNPLVSVALSPNFVNDGTLFAVTSKRSILESTNRGQSWTSVTVPSGLTAGLTVIALSPNYAAHQTLLLGSSADGIFKSTNAGASWSQVTAGMTLPAVTSLVFSPNFASDHRAYAATLGSGVLRSLNAGVSWMESNSGISDLNVSSLALSLTYGQDSTVWITTAAGGVYQSNNRAVSWTATAAVSRHLSGLTTTHYEVVAPAGGALLFLAMYEGMWTSNDRGASWNYIDLLPTRLIRYVNLSPNYASDHTVFANTYGGGNLWSTDSGSTWTFQNTGMQSSYTDAAGFSPNYANDHMAFSAMGNGLQRTSDGGATWQLMADLGAVTYPRGLAVSPNFAVDSTVLIGTNNGDSQLYPPTVTYKKQQYPNQGLFISVDRGENWIPTDLGGPPISSIAMSPGYATDHTAFTTSPQTGLYKSTDGGLHWTQLTVPSSNPGLVKVVVSPSFPTDQTLFVACITGGVYKSIDGGNSWSLLNGTNKLRVLDFNISPNYAVDESLFAGTVQKGLVRFTHGGDSMFQVAGFTDNFVTAVGLSPNFGADHTLFAAAYHGLYMSTDNGSSWSYTTEPARIEEARNVNTGTNEQPPQIVYQGNWSWMSPSNTASTYAYMSTSESQDTAVVNFVGSGIRWISQKGPVQGSATVQLDGVTQGTVNLRSPTALFQQNVWEQHGIYCGTHTFTVTAEPGSGQSVSLDAFDVWVDTCPYVNRPNVPGRP